MKDARIITLLVVILFMTQFAVHKVWVHFTEFNTAAGDCEVRHKYQEGCIDRMFAAIDWGDDPFWFLHERPSR